MADPILATKLYIPPPRPDTVPRPRLLEQINTGLHQDHGFGRKLTLISAPAGFGKTTLVSNWLAGGERPAAWLSLDEGDRDPERFLAYLVAALQTVALRVGEWALEALHAPQPPATESILTALLNEIAAIPDTFTLVLDDFHVVDSTTVDQILAFLLNHLPPQMHLIVTTREDPQLPLARYRARGQLTELRAADLRFTPDEAAAFLNQVMGLDLSAEEVTSLENRTEGWIAGLQLAALSLQGRKDVSEFIRAFAGDNRYIVDYLVEEVLQRQPEQVRKFLLETSILDRLSGPLCDAVRFGRAKSSSGSNEAALAEQTSSQAILEALERSNLFVVPLDDKRQWYRYHQLFADVLRAHLTEEQPDGTSRLRHRVSTLHRRASEWCEQNGLPIEAICHAFSAKEFERAADLVEQTWRAMDRRVQDTMWLNLATALPKELISVRPVLSAGYAWALLQVGEFDQAEDYLRNAERWIENTTALNERPRSPSAEMVVVDDEEFRSLPATIAAARAYQAQALGDVAGAVKYGRLVLELLPEDDRLQRGVAAALLGLAYWASGDLETAERTFADGMENMRSAGNLLFAIRGTYSLADIRLAQGRLHEAIRTYEQSLQLATEQGESVLRGTADLYLRLSELYHEQGNLEAAVQHMQRGEDLGEHATIPHWRYRLCLAQARVKQAQGELEATLDLLDEAERQYIRTPVPDVRPIGAMKTRVWIAQENLVAARSWVHEHGLSFDDDLSYLREFEHITLARLLIAEYRRDREERTLRKAMELLERLLKAAESAGRMGSAIEILMLQALAHGVQGDISSALTPLKRALLLAEPEGYVRTFVDEGPPMAELLGSMKDEAAWPLEDGGMKEYVHRLLASVDKQDDVHPSAFGHQPLVEPLSERELEVLQLIAEGYSNREIGERLFLALSTVKGHNRNIYGKLQVQRRTEAVARARELELL